MNIEKKFEKGALSRSYQRIDSDYLTNIYLGYNEFGQMSMVITEFGKETLVKSTKFIDVKLSRREDGKLALTFDLQDDAYMSMFLIFCKDIITICESAGCERAISAALTRWKYWKEMFGRKNQVTLDKMAVKGLIGELLELSNHIMEEFGETEAIQSWMGPLLGHKDFEIEETWYEVKSVNDNATQINISSLEQLESDVDGHLVVVRLEETSAVSSISMNLNSIVMRVMDKIESHDNLSLFQTRLDNMGYIPDLEYDKYNFLFKGRQCYSVSDEFPRIRRKDLNSSIGNAKYSILIDGISKYREE